MEVEYKSSDEVYDTEICGLDIIIQLRSIGLIQFRMKFVIIDQII